LDHEAQSEAEAEAEEDEPRWMQYEVWEGSVWSWAPPEEPEETD
jgi:hypothetical protein